jgi:serine/threonine-protein kinase
MSMLRGRRGRAIERMSIGLGSLLALAGASPAGGAEPAPPETASADRPEEAEASPEASPETPPTQPPAAVAPAPVEITKVRIAINATPWAMIEIDGEPVGETPLSDVSLPVGRHRFVARMPDGSVRERVIRIDADHDAVVFD